MIESKNLFSKSWSEGPKVCPITRPRWPFRSGRWGVAGKEVLQAVRRCRRWASAPGAARLVFECLSRLNRCSDVLETSWHFLPIRWLKIFFGALRYGNKLSNIAQYCSIKNNIVQERPIMLFILFGAKAPLGLPLLVKDKVKVKQRSFKIEGSCWTCKKAVLLIMLETGTSYI